MNNRIRCQLIDILLDKDYKFTNKYLSVVNGSFDYDTLLQDYLEDKNMNTIKVDNANQSVCFANQKDMVSIYDGKTKKEDSYYEEIHIHCNDLYNFEEFVNYLKTNYPNKIEEVKELPHSEAINGDFNNYELVMGQMTNEIATTKTLVNILSKRSDETIFRALAIHFGKLASNSSDINIDLIHKLNKLYQDEVVNKYNSIFSIPVADRIKNILTEEKSNRMLISDMPSNKDYNISLKDNEEYDNDY